jgi:hypothetical protein
MSLLAKPPMQRGHDRSAEMIGAAVVHIFDDDIVGTYFSNY